MHKKWSNIIKSTLSCTYNMTRIKVISKCTFYSSKVDGEFIYSCELEDSNTPLGYKRNKSDRLDTFPQTFSYENIFDIDTAPFSEDEYIEELTRHLNENYQDTFPNWDNIDDLDHDVKRGMSPSPCR